MSAGDRFLTTAKFEVFSKNLNRRLAALGVAPVTSTTTVIHQGAERFIELLDCPDSYTGKHHTVLQPDSGEDYLEFTGSPTVANLYLSNDTDTPTDVLIQYLLGATPVAKFTMGIDDSDEDKWKLANKDALGTTPTSGGFIFGDTLYYVHGKTDSIAGVSLADFATDATYIAGGTGSGDGQFSDPKQIAFDETYIYVSDDVNNRVQKFLISDGSFVGKTADNVTRPWGCVYWDGFIYVGCFAGTYAQTIRKFDAETLIYQSAFGSVGSGDDQFNNPRGMTTDGTYLYIADYNNNRIKKHLLDGTYVAKTGSTGTGNGEFKGPTAIATDGTSLYVCDYANGRVQIFLCSDLSYVGQVAMQTRGGKVGAPMAITLDSDYFYVTSNNSNPYNGYIEKYDIATNTFQAFYDATIGVGGPLDTAWGAIILKTQERIGDLLIVHQDGQYFDIYPKARHYDAIRLMEDSATQVEYVGIKAPSAITESYSLTLPAAVAAAQGHLYGSVTGVLAWGQDLNTAASPEFAGLTLTGEAGVLKATAGVVSSDAVIDDLDDVDAAAPNDDDILRFDTVSGTWKAEALPAAGTHDLLSASHGDSTASAVSRGSIIVGDSTPKWAELAVGTAGQAVITDGTDVSWGAPTAAAHNLLSAQHGDTTSSNPNNGDVITWDAGTGKWKAAAPGVGALALDDLSDVSASSPSDGDSLVWDSTTSKWIPEAVAGGGGAPTDAQYVTLAVNGTLSAERVLTAGAGITLTDAGAGSTVTLAGNPDVMTRHDWIHEHFDALTTGSILGQGSYNEVGAWQDDGLAAGSTAVVAVKSGSDKMLTITNKAAAGATNSYIGAVLTSALGFEAGGRLHFKFRINQGGSNYGGRVALSRDAGNQCLSIYFRYSTTFQIAYWNGSTGTKIQDALKDTWYTVDAFWIYGSGHIYINGTYVYSFTGAATGYKWDRVSISSYSPAGGNDCVLDVDDLIVSSILPLGITV